MFSPIDPYLIVGVFYLLGVWAWVRFLRTESRVFYALTAIALAFALLTSPAGATLLVTLFLVDRLLIRGGRDRATALARCGLLGLLTVSLLAVEFVIRGGQSGVEIQLGLAFLVNLAQYLAFLVFPWGFDAPFVFAVTLVVVAGFVLIAIRRRSAVLVFLGMEAVLLLIPYALLPPDSFTPGALYLPAMSLAVVFALFLFRSGESVYHRSHAAMAVAAGLALLVLLDGVWIVGAAAGWTNIVRQTRQAYREITSRHSTFSNDTYLYFIGPPSIQDLSGLMYTQYGDRVSVAGSYDDLSLSQVPYPTLQKTESAKPIDRAAGRLAQLRAHKTSFVYYFLADGTSIEVPVAPEAITASTPALPITFNAPIRLEGYEITADTLKAGDTLVLLLYWRATQKIA